MKKITAILMILALTLALACCGGNEHSHTHEEGTSSSEENHNHGEHTHNPSGPALNKVEKIDVGMKEHFDADEDKDYHELFFDKKTSDFENKTFTKTGVFAHIYDAYNETDRYYIWGWGDEARTCCYQWEFLLPENTEMPVPGSLLTVKGTMAFDEKALDKYWLTDTEITVDEKAEDCKYDFDFTTLSPVLTRVLITNMNQLPESFTDKSVRIIGKALSENTMGSASVAAEWSVHFSGSKDHLDSGALILVEGVFNQGGEGAVIASTSVTAEG